MSQGGRSSLFDRPMPPGYRDELGQLMATEPQKAALHQLVKTPLVYTSVAIRNWTAFQKLGVVSITAPGSYHTTVRLNPQVDIGDYVHLGALGTALLLRSPH